MRLAATILGIIGAVWGFNSGVQGFLEGVAEKEASNTFTLLLLVMSPAALGLPAALRSMTTPRVASLLMLLSVISGLLTLRGLYLGPAICLATSSILSYRSRTTGPANRGFPHLIRNVSERVFAGYVDGMILIILGIGSFLWIPGMQEHVDLFPVFGTVPGLLLSQIEVEVSNTPTTLWLISSAVGLFGYYVIFEAGFRRTPGKWIVNHRLQMENGTPISLKLAIIRALLRPVEFLSLVIPVGWIVAFVTSGHQTFLDFLTRTRSVRPDQEHVATYNLPHPAIEIGTLALLAIIALGIVILPRQQTFPEAANQEDCFDFPATWQADLDKDILGFTIVPCDQPHDGEVLYSLEVPYEYKRSDYLEAKAYAGEFCSWSFQSYVGVKLEESVLKGGFYFPSKEKWEAAHREFLCFAYSDSSKLHGSVYLTYKTIPAPVQSTLTPIAEQTTISVWRVGSPHEGDTPTKAVPLELLIAAEDLGYRLEMEAFPAQGFAERFSEALRGNVEPDILSFGNIGIIRGITTDLGHFQGIAEDPAVENSLIFVDESLSSLDNGWQVLISTSQHHNESKSLALRKVECAGNTDVQSPSNLGEIELQQLTSLGIEISTAYLAGDLSTLQQYTDDKRLSSDSLGKDSQPLETQVCAAMGNQNLVFMSIIASFQGQRVLGHKTVLVVLRKNEATWRLLTVTVDPISIEAMDDSIPRLAGLLTGDSVSVNPPQPAVLQSPKNGEYPQRNREGRFGDFKWQPSPSSDVIAEVGEFEYLSEARLFLRFRSEQEVNADGISAGQLWSTGGMWQWRIWSITRGGAIAFSDIRLFEH